MIESLEKDRWFIDIRGQIRGMTAWQIIEGLLSKELKVIFRVSRDRANWKAICNQEYFQQAVTELIKTLSKEATKYGGEAAEKNSNKEASGFHNLKNITSGISAQLQHASKLQDINVHLHGLRYLAAEFHDKKKLIIDLDATPAQDEMHPDDRNEYINAFSFWGQFKFLLNPKYRQRVLGTVFFIAIASGGIVKYIEHQKNKADELVADQAREALQAKIMGDYSRAVAIFSGVQDISSIDPKTLLQIAEAHIETKGYDTGAQLLKKIAALAMSPEDKARTQSLLGFISIKTNHPSEAKMYYEQSLQEFQFYQSLYNLAILNLDSRNPEVSEQLLLKAITIRGNQRAPILLALFESAAQLDIRANKARKPGRPAEYMRLDKINQLLEEFAQEGQPYYEELLAAQIISASVRGDNVKFESLNNIWMDLDPAAAVPKKLEKTMDYHRATWGHLNDWCLSVYNNPNISNLKAGFYSGCVARARGLKEALPFAHYAYMNIPHVQPALRGLLSFLLLANENFEGAKQILRSGNIESSKLAMRAVEEVCATHPDADCNERKVATPNLPLGKKPNGANRNSRL